MKSEVFLNRTESAALRGIAILGIILHNYCHFLGFAVKENEYKFDPARPMQFFDKLFSLDSDLFIHLFSFLGHYGVPVFLFISGYGLVKKYEPLPTSPKGRSAYGQTSAQYTNPLKENREQPPTPQATPPLRGGWVGYHFLKLFRLMIIGYLAFIAVYLLRHSDGAQVYSWDRVLTQLTMTINFLYFDPDHIIKPGPYWYFGLMLQIYLLYILVIHRWRKDRVLLAFALGSILLEACFENQQDWLNYIRYNFIGGLLPFCMGIWISRLEFRREKRDRREEGNALALLSVILISALAVLFGSMYFWSWLLVPVFIVTGAVATVKLFSASETLLSPLNWMGSISAMLFVMHPIARELIISHYRRIDIYGGILIYLLSSVALAILLNWVLQFIPTPKH